MAEGKIIKALSGFYYVLSQDVLYQCRGRGNFRKRKITPLVGDNCVFEAENQTDGYILDILERKNELVRPPVANVDQAILVFSLAEPEFSQLLLDRFLVQVESKNVEPLICLTKHDLEANDGKVSQIVEVYQHIGYQVFVTSTKTNRGLEHLKEQLQHKITVFAGQSGVGKSSILNALVPSLDLHIAQISTHLGRGRHTTRHVELIHVDEGLVADTPGFSSLDFKDIEPEDLSLYFPEMKALINECKFRGCTHTAEPKCAVKAAVEKKQIDNNRYNNYLNFIEEIKEQTRRY